MPLPPAQKLALTDSERKQLQAISRHRGTPRGIALRVNIILGAALGTANHVLARELTTSVPTVLLWRRRFESDGLAGVMEDRQRSGRPKRISAEREAALVEATINTTPKDATHWSVRTMAANQKISPATVQRIWKKHKLQPHRIESFKFSYRELWKQQQAARTRLDRLLRKTKAIRTRSAARTTVPTRILNHSFAFTGKIPDWVRESKLYPTIKGYGGTVKEFEGLNYAECLVHGDIPGGKDSTRKLRAARRDGIEIINQSEFFRILDNERRLRRRKRIARSARR